MSATFSRRLVAAAVVLVTALLAAPLIASTGQRSISPTAASRQIARKYVKALRASNAKALGALFTTNAVEIDKVLGSANAPATEGRAGIEESWTGMWAGGGYRFSGSVACSNPYWVVVSWVMTTRNNEVAGDRSATVHGISILDLNIRKGQISSETLYYDLPGQ